MCISAEEEGIPSTRIDKVQNPTTRLPSSMSLKGQKNFSRHCPFEVRKVYWRQRLMAGNFSENHGKIVLIDLLHFRDDTKIMTHTLQCIIDITPLLPPFLIPLTMPWKYCNSNTEVKYGDRSSKFTWAPVYSCTHWLRLPQSPPSPPQLGSYTRALLASQDRRHLFVNPCSNIFGVLLWHSFQLQPPLNRERFHQTLSNSVRSTWTERNPANPWRNPRGGE